MTTTSEQITLPVAIQELIEKEAIRDVIYRFTRGADRLIRDLVQSCYHPDAIDNHGGYNGPGLGFYDAANAVEVQKVLHHHLGQIYIELDGDVAKTETYFIATLIRDVDGKDVVGTMLGRYLDRFEKRNGEWKIAYRFVAFDGTIGDPGMGPIPEGSWGRRDESDYSHTLFSDKEK